MRNISYTGLTEIDHLPLTFQQKVTLKVAIKVKLTLLFGADDPLGLCGDITEESEEIDEIPALNRNQDMFASQKHGKRQSMLACCRCQCMRRDTGWWSLVMCTGFGCLYKGCLHCHCLSIRERLMFALYGTIICDRCAGIEAGAFSCSSIRQKELMHCLEKSFRNGAFMKKLFGTKDMNGLSLRVIQDKIIAKMYFETLDVLVEIRNLFIRLIREHAFTQLEIEIASSKFYNSWLLNGRIACPDYRLDSVCILVSS